MLQIIGVMVGGYILFRMVDALCSPERNVFVKVCAVLVGLFTVFCIFAMVVQTPKTPPIPSSMIR